MLLEANFFVSSKKSQKYSSLQQVDFYQHWRLCCLQTAKVYVTSAGVGNADSQSDGELVKFVGFGKTMAWHTSYLKNDYLIGLN